MRTISEIRRANLLVLSDELGGKPALADRIGKVYSQLSQWINASKSSETGRPRTVGDDSARHIEKSCGKPRGWLDVSHESNVGAVDSSRNSVDVPLISWVRAGQWSDVSDPYAAGDAEDWKACPVRHGDRSYALKVKGFSMSNPGGKPSFEEGDIIFVDPDREPAHRSLVIVRLDDQNEATFKRLIVDGDSKFLEALNPSWPDRIIKVNGNATFCGVVIARMESYI